MGPAVRAGFDRVRLGLDADPGARRRRSVNRGFVLSDHADWPGLLSAIDATGAETVWLTHGYTAVVARYLRDRGHDAVPVATRYEGEQEEALGPEELEPPAAAAE